MRRLARAARESKVRKQRAAVGVDEHVGGLQVAMHDARVVRVLQAVPDLAQVAPRGKRVQRAALHDVAQRSAADQGHRQVGDALGHLEVVDGEDVRVVELGERLRLGLESLDEALVLEQLRR